MDRIERPEKLNNYYHDTQSPLLVLIHFLISTAWRLTQKEIITVGSSFCHGNKSLDEFQWIYDAFNFEWKTIPLR